MSNAAVVGPEGRSNSTGASVAIIGAGAVGLALGTALHAGGDAVHFGLRPGGGEGHGLEGGVRRTGLFGEVEIPGERLSLFEGLEALVDLDPDFILVCTKTTATGALAPALGRALASSKRPVPIVICHNGWGSAQHFADHVDPARIFSARVITGFRRLAPGLVDVTVHAAPIAMGSLFGADPRRIELLCAHISAGGLPCVLSDDIGADLLAKWLYNGLLNPLGALAGVPYGVLGERAETRSIMEAVAHEIFAVINAAELRTHWRDADSYLATFYDELLPPTAAHESSMLQDLRLGRPTEIDSLSGAVVSLGREFDVPTATNHALALLIKAAEQTRR